MLPCVIAEDDHLLVVNKPAGWNTHAPHPFAGEGLYDWLRHREPRWSRLAIIHRLDKETSGVLVFGKTPQANRSLTAQFTERAVRKKYVLLTLAAPRRPTLTAESRIARSGERFRSGTQGEKAITRFSMADAGRSDFAAGILVGTRPARVLEAAPLTGRTHQIRVHAAEQGFPIVGDTLYGGPPFHRVCLHAAEISFEHPATGKRVTFTALADFKSESSLILRSALIDSSETDAFRLMHGAADRRPGWYLDKLGPFWLSQSERALDFDQRRELEHLLARYGGEGVYHKTLTRHVRRAGATDTSPKHLLGNPAPDRFVIRENGLQFETCFGEGYSTGLFLDQRDNRRRFLTGHVAADFSLWSSSVESKPEVLNTFAYTCGFSVCAARGGAHTTSLDLSRKYLDWGRRNFLLNGIPPEDHDFIFGDVFDWLRRLAKKGRTFDAVVLDPPTFSQSKAHGVFRVEKDYQSLVELASPLLKPGGVLFASANAAGLDAETFLNGIRTALKAVGRAIEQEHYFPQPPDLPVARAEPAHLKTVWLRVR